MINLENVKRIGEPARKIYAAWFSPFSGDVKERVRRKHPENGNRRIEVHHIDPYYRSQNDNISNAMPVTLPEHAVIHHRQAVTAENWDDARRNYGAVRLIVRRMSRGELIEFNQMITKRDR